MTLHTYLHVLTVRDRQFICERIDPPSIEYPRPLALAATAVTLEVDDRNRIIQRNTVGIDARDGDQTVIAELVENALSTLGEDGLLTGFDLGTSLAAAAIAGGHGSFAPIPAITRAQWSYDSRDLRLTCLGATPPPIPALYPLATDLRQPLSLDQIASDDWPVIRALTEHYAELAMCRCALRHQPRRDR